jgi:YbgC/YbaW family acyl-CoA thioester hydrolase
MIVHSIRIVLNMLSGYSAKLPTSLPYRVAYTCWPIDIDPYIHMNNSSYLRIAEYSRWRLYAQSGLASQLKGVLFLVVENKVSYFKPINPFQTFVISTQISSTENKWMHYKHTFKHPTKDDLIYAVVEAKAVWKEQSGKTVTVSSLSDINGFVKKMLEEAKDS